MLAAELQTVQACPQRVDFLVEAIPLSMAGGGAVRGSWLPPVLSGLADVSFDTWPAATH